MTASAVADPGEEAEVSAERKEQAEEKEADIAAEPPGDTSPPESAELQEDGSYVQVLEDGSSIRWTQRPDGSWRRPEKSRAPTGVASRIAAELSATTRATAEVQVVEPVAEQRVEVDDPPAVSCESPSKVSNSNGAHPAEPPPEAALQPDGSYLLELPDRSTLRWTKRPDGSWRKPERKREGWIGDLEVEKYAPPPVRDGSGIGALEIAGDEQETTGTLADGENLTNGVAEEKHQLQHRWCFWLNRRAKLLGNLPWSQRGMLGYEFETAEDFWGMTKHSYPPSRLEDIDCSLFKKGLPPAWEDPLFGVGGRWVLRLEKVKAQTLDSLWLSLSMALIGESFAEIGGELVAGAIVSVRSRTTRIALWLTKATDEKKVMALGFGLRDALAQTADVSDIESKEFVFEDFRTQAITLQLPRPGVTGLTEGIFQ